MYYLDDHSLGYDQIRWSSSAGSRLVLDSIYRHAHLPLVNPQHSDVIPFYEDYHFGRYETKRYSLAIPFSIEDLQMSHAFRAVDAAMREASFSPKIAWDVMDARQARLHATICGRVNADDVKELLLRTEDHLLRTGSIRFRLAGPLVGEKNTGRIYFPVYPENREGNPIQTLQMTLGKQITDVYLLGYYNFRDHLAASEAAELSSILAKFRDVTILEGAISGLVAFETQDDLVLSGCEIGRSTNFSQS